MKAIEIILLLYFGYVSCYAFISAVAALLYKERNPPDSILKRKIAVLIPSYKEDSVIIDVAANALMQTYPQAYYDVVVIADCLQSETVKKLKSLPIQVVEVSFDKSTKVRSLNKAIQTIGDDYDFALILDADNVMEKDFLHRMNNLLTLGYKAVQAERVSKNQDTPMSVLDGLSERINNFIYRQGAFVLGLSSSLIGSGMVFEYQLLKRLLSSMDSIGGFDRELELKLIQENVRIFYAKGLKVYDEKVQNTVIFERQRTRWLSSQFVYLKKYFVLGIKALFTGKLSLLNSAILKNIQLPRLINLGLLMILCTMGFLFKSSLHLPYLIWWIFLLLNILAIAFAIPPKLYNRQLFRSIILLPTVFVKMFNLLFKLKGANKEFIHTPHGVGGLTATKE